MGQTNKNIIDEDFIIEKQKGESVIALAGNPNVGKSTVFNYLTGLKQHTGNWTGKTVQNAMGQHTSGENHYIMVDIPGTYSLMAHSAEEEVARDFICFGEPDAVIIVCDATCIERNLNLVLQTIEITNHSIVCVNLLDEAKKKKIHIDLEKLSKRLGVKVFGITARNGEGIDEMISELPQTIHIKTSESKCVIYSEHIENAVNILADVLRRWLGGKLSARWTALRLLENDEKLTKSICDFTGLNLETNTIVSDALQSAARYLAENDIDLFKFKDSIITSIIETAEDITNECVSFEQKDYYERDRKIDRIVTHKIWGVPIMVLLLLVIFWITIVGANYPSDLLFDALFGLGDKMSASLDKLGTPEWLISMLIDGVYKVLAWVTSVMLPPMAIFFPLFTLLEDFGYLPRVAFNLDKYFKKAKSCGKQALTMAMGFGCNAAGVTGCRIIDSPRERLIAIITNNFVPCNGRFPTLIAIIAMFFVSAGMMSSFFSVVILTGVILLGIMLTFMVSGLLSKTVLKGEPSSFTLELPPYRKPQIWQVIVRSLLDRTVFVLGRAVTVAAPAGLLIWIMANVSVDGQTLLCICKNFLEPFGNFLGLDGVIILAFILGFPANEIVVPIMLMAYMSSGKLVSYDNLDSLKSLFVENGWTNVTALCTMLLMLCHFPCSTTVMTIYKETKSIKWTLVSVVLPTIIGIVMCAIVANLSKIVI